VSTTTSKSAAQTSRTVEVDFLYLDLATCSRCRTSDDALDAAVEILRPVLDSLGTSVEVRKTLVDEGVKDYLKDKRLLLVLDNFEQVLEAAPLAGELLSAPVSRSSPPAAYRSGSTASTSTRCRRSRSLTRRGYPASRPSPSTRRSGSS
jgi:hypothetical protein